MFFIFFIRSHRRKKIKVSNICVSKMTFRLNIVLIFARNLNRFSRLIVIRYVKLTFIDLYSQLLCFEENIISCFFCLNFFETYVLMFFEIVSHSFRRFFSKFVYRLLMF